jgi:hypothetical protein
VVVADKSSGKIYTSDIDAPKFVAEDESFKGMGDLSYVDGDLAFADDGGYRVYSTSSSTVTEEYTADSLGVLAPYLDFVYSLSGDTITKFSKVPDGLDGSVWGTSSDFERAVSIAIDGAIYVLGGDGSLVSYTQGKDDKLVVAGLDKPLKSPVQVVSGFDMDNIYIADAGNNRVVVLDKKFDFVRELLPTKEEQWGDMKGIGISQDESVAFVLSGSRVYKVEL